MARGPNGGAIAGTEQRCARGTARASMERAEERAGGHAESPIHDFLRRILAGETELPFHRDGRAHRERRHGAPHRADGGRTQSPPRALRHLVQTMKRAERGAIEDFSSRCEPRAVTATIPALGVAIPSNDAAEMRTDGGALVDDALQIAIEGHLAPATLDDCPLPRRERLFWPSILGAQPL